MPAKKMDFKRNLIEEIVDYINNNNYKKFVVLYNRFRYEVKGHYRILKACIDNFEYRMMIIFLKDGMIDDPTEALEYLIVHNRDDVMFNLIYTKGNKELTNHKYLIDRAIDSGYDYPLELIYDYFFDNDLEMMNYMIRKCVNSGRDKVIRYILCGRNTNFYSVHFCTRNLIRVKNYELLRDILRYECVNCNDFMISAIRIGYENAFDLIYNTIHYSEMNHLECLEKSVKYSNFYAFQALIAKRNFGKMYLKDIFPMTIKLRRLRMFKEIIILGHFSTEYHVPAIIDSLKIRYESFFHFICTHLSNDDKLNALCGLISHANLYEFKRIYFVSKLTLKPKIDLLEEAIKCYAEPIIKFIIDDIKKKYNIIISYMVIYDANGEKRITINKKYIKKYF